MPDQPEAARPAHRRRRPTILERLRQRRRRRARHDPLPAAGAGPDHRLQRRAAPSTSSPCEGPTRPTVNTWAGQLVDAARATSRRCATSPPTCRARASSAFVDIDRDTAARLAITAVDRRRRALRRLRPADHLDHLHRVQPVPGDPRGRPEPRSTRRRAWPDLYMTAASGAPTPLSAIATVETADRAAADQPRGPVPGRQHLLRHRAGRLAGRRGERDPAGREAQIGVPGDGHHHLPGRRRRLPGLAGQRAVADPGGDRHRLHRAGRALRELHPPGHHPLHPALGRASARCWP